jgi:hypothetical protein
MDLLQRNKEHYYDIEQMTWLETVANFTGTPESGYFLY